MQGGNGGLRRRFWTVKTSVRWIPSARVAAALAVLLGSVGAAEARCHTFLIFYNDGRIVPGPVNTECDRGSEHMHSAPFGNWGVKSPHSGYWDGWQFAGWRPEDGWRQWNSCTSEYRSQEDLPEEPQLPDPDDSNVYARKTQRDRSNRTCESIHSGRTHKFRGEYMKVYELDSRGDLVLGGNGSDLVTTIRYRDISVSMNCTSASVCRGDSGWITPRWNSRVRASIKIVIYTNDYRTR